MALPFPASGLRVLHAQCTVNGKVPIVWCLAPWMATPLVTYPTGCLSPWVLTPLGTPLPG